MKWSTIVHLFALLSFAIESTLAISLSLPTCEEKCGNTIIPFPFGIGSNCSGDPSFTIICRNSTTPFLSSINMEALNISILGTVVVNLPVSPMNCSANLSTGRLPMSLRGSPFTISARYNTLALLGCKNSVWLLANETTAVGGCTAMCKANSTETSCNGINCCQTTLQPRLKDLRYTYKTIEPGNVDDSSCGYFLPVDKIWLRNHYKRFKGLIRDPVDREFGYAPLVLEWEFGELKGNTGWVCTYSDDDCLTYPDDFGRRRVYDNEECRRKHHEDECSLFPTRYSVFDCKSASVNALYLYNTYYEGQFSAYDGGYDYVSSIKYCSCPDGYEGNPYLPEKCVDIDECRNATDNHCGSLSCTNVKGSFTCKDQNAKNRTRLKIAFISIGSGLGALLLLFIAWKSTKAIWKRIKANRRRKFFKRNGGLLLEQQLSATENGLDKTRLYGSKELTLATDHFNENRILGRGGQGTVYKGMLKDGRIVAVKKSKKVEEAHLQVFINEVVILSQVNHRNVVKLLGCCLETEVPLLVYEFIPNGTLFQHIHDPNEEFPLTWEMRVRIAREIAGSLAYLHSAASAPIYHRDVKSTNILLDDKYRARISDFGTSRSISIDKTHLTTQVQGTFGYFDPEYFQSSQFTDKSDVYSFGVVMIELLTGEKAVSSIRIKEGRGLAAHFLHSLEENQLFDIIDARILQEGKREEIMAVAELAKRCLHLNGKRRPTMKEVAAKLESIKEVEEWSHVEQDRECGSRECLSIEVAESHSFSSIASFTPETEHPLLGD